MKWLLTELGNITGAAGLEQMMEELVLFLAYFMFLLNVPITMVGGLKMKESGV